MLEGEAKLACQLLMGTQKLEREALFFISLSMCQDRHICTYYSYNRMHLLFSHKEISMWGPWSDTSSVFDAGRMEFLLAGKRNGCLLTVFLGAEWVGRVF